MDKFHVVLYCIVLICTESYVNLLKPNDIYIYMSYRSANSRRYILNIYSTNIHSEYFKRAA